VSAARIVSRSLIAVLALGALVVQGGAAWGARWVWDNEQLLKDQRRTINAGGIGGFGGG
jgi:hypothetical protein